jgi:hypothetical protein
MTITPHHPPQSNASTIPVATSADAIGLRESLDEYPSDWSRHNPFHDGEIQLQKLAGTHRSVMSFAPKFIRPFLPEQHQEFYRAQSFLVAASRDADGNMWSTLLVASEGPNQSRCPGDFANLVDSPDPVTLHIRTQPVQGDALFGQIQVDSDLGLLGIEFASKRRNRVNGRILYSTPNDGMVLRVDQSFGNCPQYIKPRKEWWWNAEKKGTEGASPTFSSSTKPSHLSELHIKTIQGATTIFLATGYRGQGKDTRFGNDASHRGGPPGFLLVRDKHTIVLPDFAGNNFFNSLGNLVMDSRMGLTIPDFESGGMLQLSGRAQVEMDTHKAAQIYPGALRLTMFLIEQVNVVPAGTFAIRWSIPSKGESRLLEVVSIVQESVDVKSFHLAAPATVSPNDDDKTSNHKLWGFKAGQHLPIELQTKDGEILRTYSLSGSPSLSSNTYRISVKREPLGKASNHLHDYVQVGDLVQVSRPAGDFTWRASELPVAGEVGENSGAKTRTLVLLSSGVGITPILSMLYQYVAQSKDLQAPRPALWLHGARDGAHHPFREEVSKLVQHAQLRAHLPLQTHVVYSRPSPKDAGLYDSIGRIRFALLQNIVIEWKDAEYFMCGSSSMMTDMEESLLKAGVRASDIHFETF